MEAKLDYLESPECSIQERVDAARCALQESRLQTAWQIMFWTLKAKNWVYSMCDDNKDMYQMLLQASPLPNVSYFPCKAKWLKPKNYGPSILCDIAQTMFATLKAHKWYIPEYEVEFGFSGWLKSYVTVHVENIRGPGFLLGFSGAQGHVEDDFERNDTSGFSFIYMDGKFMHFYEDRSSPSMCIYDGFDWHAELRTINSSIFIARNHWKKLTREDAYAGDWEAEMKTKLFLHLKHMREKVQTTL